MRSWGVSDESINHHQNEYEGDELIVLYGNVKSVQWFLVNVNNLFDFGMTGIEKLNYTQLKHGLEMDGFSPKAIKDMFWRIREIADAIRQ